MVAMENGRKQTINHLVGILLENGKNFCRFLTTTTSCLKTAENKPSTILWGLCWKTAEISAVFQQLVFGRFPTTQNVSAVFQQTGFGCFPTIFFGRFPHAPKPVTPDPGSNDACREFLVDQCLSSSGNPQVEVVHNVTMDECSFFCNTIYKDNCTFYIQDNKQRICEIWTMDFGTYEQGCTKHEGPKSPLWDPQVDSPTGCEDDKCKVCSDLDKYTFIHY